MRYADELRVNSIVLAEMEEEAMENQQLVFSFEEMMEDIKTTCNQSLTVVEPITIISADEAGNPITITYNK